jgi:hypothetical protein
VRRLLARGREADDTPEVASHRLDTIGEKTLPMLDSDPERERPVVEVQPLLEARSESPEKERCDDESGQRAGHGGEGARR